jgi:hypothetical protein
MFRRALVCCLFAQQLAALPSSAQSGAAPRALDASTPITYFIGDGRREIGFQPSDRELALWALQAWQQSAGGAIRLEPAAEPDALVRVYWAGPNDGQYGEARSLEVRGRQGAAVFVRPDMDALGPEIALRARADSLLRETIVYLTCVHELGHAFGLEHTSAFDDIMYYFGYGGDISRFFGRYRARLRARTDIQNVSGLSDQDVVRLKALYPPR